MKTQHTPTPWRVSSEFLIVSDDKRDATIAECLTHDLSDHETSANATHIVKCVNLHDELIQEVKGKVNALQFDIDNDWNHELHPEQVTNMEREIRRLKDLLKRAKGEA